jgi:hypothetical protein
VPHAPASIGGDHAPTIAVVQGWWWPIEFMSMDVVVTPPS